MKIDVNIPAVLEPIAPYGLNVGEGMRVPLNTEKTVFEAIIRLTGSVFFRVNPWTGSSIHVGAGGTQEDDVDKSFAELAGEKLPPGTVLKFTL